MLSLFSSFDFYTFNFIFTLFFFVFISNSLWLSNSLKLSFNYFYSFYLNLFSLSKGFSFKFMILVHFIILYFLILMNYTSLFFFNFPLSSQFSVCFYFSFSFWLSFMFFYFFKKVKGLIEHLVPQGCPWYLIFFLFLIEILSSIIRPLTLSVRLMANIVSGHCIMSFIFFMCGDITSFFLLLGFSYFEFCVAFIQAHIFSSLLFTYYSDLK